MKKNRLAQYLLGMCVAGVMSAGADVVFQYSFPASYAGPGDTLVDLSSAGNNATLTGGGALIDDRPAGFDASLMSLSGSNGGHGKTDAIDLLNTAAVVANGGFIMDVWFKWEGTYTSNRKLIDYAGTEYLKTQNNQVLFGLDNGTTTLSYDIVGGQWYHAVGVFDTLGNSAVADPSTVYAGEFMVDGFASLYIDGALVDSAAGTKSGFGDSLDRSIGLNMWPNAGDYNQGNIFNPTVELIPEPATFGMIAMVGGGMLFIRRKMMM